MPSRTVSANTVRPLPRSPASRKRVVCRPYSVPSSTSATWSISYAPRNSATGSICMSLRGRAHRKIRFRCRMSPSTTLSSGSPASSYATSASRAASVPVAPIAATRSGSSANRRTAAFARSSSPPSSTVVSRSVNGASPRALCSATASRAARSWPFPMAADGPLRSAWSPM
ncbi:hypothetical protein GA0115255_104021, partial [Streptomyces sp. Ncost-T6T-2b]